MPIPEVLDGAVRRAHEAIAHLLILRRAPEFFHEDLAAAMANYREPHEDPSAPRSLELADAKLATCGWAIHRFSSLVRKVQKPKRIGILASEFDRISLMLENADKLELSGGLPREADALGVMLREMLAGRGLRGTWDLTIDSDANLEGPVTPVYLELKAHNVTLRIPSTESKVVVVCYDMNLAYVYRPDLSTFIENLSSRMDADSRGLIARAHELNVSAANLRHAKLP